MQLSLPTLTNLAILILSATSVQAIDLSYSDLGLNHHLSGRDMNNIWNAQYFQARDLTGQTNDYNQLYAREADAEGELYP